MEADQDHEGLPLWEKAKIFISGGYKQWPLARRVWVSFALVLAVGAANALISIQGVLRVAGDNEEVVRAHQVVSEIQRTLEAMLGMETDTRGYVITGRQDFLESFQKYKAAIPRQLESLRIFARDHSIRTEDFSKLENLLQEKSTFMEKAIGTRTKQGREAAMALIAHGKGPRLMDDIRDLLVEMRAGEEELLFTRIQQSRRGISLIRNAFLLLDFVIFLFLCSMIYLMTRDLVAHEEITRAVKLSEEKFRGVLEAAPDAMIIVDEKGRITLANAQALKLFGWDREEMLGKTIEALVPEMKRKNHLNQREAFLRSPHARAMGIGMELSGLKKDGTEFPAEISLSPLKTDEGVLVITAVRDVTERSRMLEEENRRMQEANRLKSEFLANMSHELRTPMNGIIGFSELIYNDKDDKVSPTHREYLGDILASSRHLLQLINDILDLSKVESGKVEFKPEPVELKMISNEVRDLLRGMASQKQLQVEVQVDPAANRVVLDGLKFKQVLYNYLSNAIKFTAERGKIIVRILPDTDGFFKLEVEDNGVGIKPADIPRLFVEFQQLDSSLSKRYAGTGLGLALVKRLVEAQGGGVGVKSSLGKGSLFFAVLPTGLKNVRLKFGWQSNFRKEGKREVLMSDQEFWKAQAPLAENQMEAEGRQVANCPRCGAQTFDVEFEECGLCGHREPVRSCLACGERFPRSVLLNLEDRKKGHAGELMCPDCRGRSLG